MNYFDMHCHIVPGVDDGADTLETSIQILRKEYEDGIRNIILTPHRRIRMFEPEEAVVQEHFLALKREVAEDLPELTLYLGREYHAHLDMIQELARHPEYRMAESDYLLLEFSSQHSMAYIRDRVQEALMRGYEVIIAHCERYGPVRNSLDFADDLRRMGARLQVNADSVTGREGGGVKRFCARLLKYQMVDFIGSDAHNTTDRRTNLGECIRLVTKKYGEEYAKKIFCENPERIVTDSNY